MATNIVSLLQRVDEGWTMTTTRNKNGKKVINMVNGSNNLCFRESTKKNLCFLTALVVNSAFIGNVEHQPADKPSSEKFKLKTWEYNSFHDKFGHHGHDCFKAMAL